MLNVECDDNLIEESPPPIGPGEEAIGRRVADLVDDGATLQVGIGAIPDAVLKFLRDRSDLGVHSEMFSDGVVDLVEAGVITNRRKKLHTDKLVATLLLGTRRLYDFANDNPMVRRSLWFGATYPPSSSQKTPALPASGVTRCRRAAASRVRIACSPAGP